MIIPIIPDELIAIVFFLYWINRQKMSQLSLPEIQSKLTLLLDSGKTIIALRAADSKDYASIIDEFYETHDIASDDEIINRMDEVAGLISKAFECSSAAKSILDMGPVLDSYLKNQETKKVQKKKTTAVAEVSAIVAENLAEPVVKVKAPKSSKSKSSPTNINSLNIKPAAIKILKLFVDGKKMDLIKDVSGFTESDIYQNFTSDYWKKIEQEWSPEAIKLITTINLTNCSLPKNTLFGLNTMLNDQNVAVPASKFTGTDPTYEDTVLYQAIQKATKETSETKPAAKSTASKRKNVDQETPVVAKRAPKSIEAPNAPVIPVNHRRQTVVEVTPEVQSEESDNYEVLDNEAIKIEEFDSMDDQMDESFDEPVKEPTKQVDELVDDSNDELVVMQPIKETTDEQDLQDPDDEPFDDPIDPIEPIDDPIDEPIEEPIEEPVRPPRNSRVMKTSSSNISSFGSTSRRTPGTSQTPGRFTRRATQIKSNKLN